MKLNEKTRKEGSITVFLTLLLPLVLALIGTLLEAARIHTARAFLEADTAQSMQMMFSDYNKELWEDYHLFAYTGEEEEAKEEIKRGILAAISQEEEDSLWKTQSFDFWHLKLSDLSIESKEMLTDEDGQILKHEAVEYEKYQVSERVVNEILKLLGIMKKTGAAAHVSQKKMEAEEELYDYSEYMLKLMETVDGIDFGKTGVQYQGKKLKIKESFVRQFFYGEPELSVLGFKNDIVWESLKDNYYNPKESMEMLQGLLKEFEDACTVLENGREKIEELQSYQKELQEKKKEWKNSIRTISEEKEEAENRKDSQEIEEMEALISGYRDRISEWEEAEKQSEAELKKIQEEMKRAEKTKKSFLSSWKKESRRLKEMAESVKKCVETALELVPELKKLQESAKKSVEKYQNTIEEKKTELSLEMYESFSEDCKELAVSAGLNIKEGKKEICDLDVFENCLYENKEILQKINTGLFLENNEITSEWIVQKTKELKRLKEQAENYHISEFTFSYKMISEKQEQENPMETLKKLGNKTLLSLVVKDEKKISKNDIKEEEKVFYEVEETGFLGEGNENLSEITMESDNMFSSLFREFSTGILCNITDVDSLQAVGQSFLRDILLNSYVQDVFFNAVTEEQNRNISALRYEHEYILAGKNNDRENLSFMIKKIVAMRTVCNYIALLSDSARQKEAYAAAAVIAGFTGLEPLVEVLKGMILLVWSYEESLIDTAALLQGKKISVIKNPSQILLSFQELLGFGKTIIQKKAENLSEDKDGCGYAEYLYLLCCMQKQKITLYRLADIVQINERKRYDERFSLKEAVFGCKVRAGYVLPSIFFRIPFVTNIAGGQEGGWKMEILSEMSY